MAFLLPQASMLPPAQGQTQAVNDPFVWGQGGKRMTPEDIAMQRRLAQQQMSAAADFSPAGSFLEALGRGGQGVLGGLQSRKADRASEANSAENDAVLQALMGGGAPDNNMLMSAMSSPYASPQVQQIAKMQWERANPKPQAPTEFERILQASGIVQGSPEWTQAMQTKVQNTLDPFTNLVVGGNSVMGRQSAVQQAMQGGGGPASTGAGPVPQAPVGKLRPITGGGVSNGTGGF